MLVSYKERDPDNIGRLSPALENMRGRGMYLPLQSSLATVRGFYHQLLPNGPRIIQQRLGLHTFLRDLIPSLRYQRAVRSVIFPP